MQPTQVQVELIVTNDELLSTVLDIFVARWDLKADDGKHLSTIIPTFICSCMLQPKWICHGVTISNNPATLGMVGMLKIASK